MKRKILLIGPLPPPRGGWSHVVATTSQMLSDSLRWEVSHFDTSLMSLAGRRKSKLHLTVRCLLQTFLLAGRLLFRRPNYAMIFTGTGKTSFRDVVMLWCLHRFGIPAYVRVFGGSYEEFLSRRSSWFQAQLVRSKLLLCELSSTAEMLRTMSIHAQVINNTADVDRIRLIEPRKLAPNRFHVVYVGSMTPLKGVERILAEVDEVCAQRAVDFHFIGDEIDEGYLDKFRASAALLKHGNHVFIHGRLPNAEMLAIVKGADVFLMLTQWPGEGQPAVLIESMLCGAVPIVTGWRGTRQIVTHLRNGIVLEPCALYTQSLISLIDDRWKLEHFSVQATADATRAHGNEQVKARLNQMLL